MLNQHKTLIIKRIIIELVIFALLLASDLVSKQLILDGMGLQMYTQYIIVDGLFAIYPCTNDGASFSIFSGQTGFLIALTAVLLIALCALMIYTIIKKPKISWLFRWSMLLIIAGGAGNLYDRIFCGGEVRDFIQYMFLDKIWLPLFGSNFGVGNIADIYLVLGVFLICVYIVFDYKEGDLGLFKAKSPKNLRPDEVPAEDESASVEKERVSEDETADNQANAYKADKEEAVETSEPTLDETVSDSHKKKRAKKSQTAKAD